LSCACPSASTLLSWLGWQKVDGVVDYHMINQRLLVILEDEGYSVAGDDPDRERFRALWMEAMKD
jgi:hypothetical protein